jgi:peptide/nickel transport system permease protein
MGVVVVVAIIVLVVNLVIDIAQGWLNPKARLQ